MTHKPSLRKQMHCPWCGGRLVWREKSTKGEHRECLDCQRLYWTDDLRWPLERGEGMPDAT